MEKSQCDHNDEANQADGIRCYWRGVTGKKMGNDKGGTLTERST